MANNPKKAKDPTEVALSAIQEALNISDAPMDGNRGSVRSDATSTIASPMPDYSQSPFDTRPSDDRPIYESSEEPQRPTHRAANHHRQALGHILHAIQKGRPPRNGYTLASIFAAFGVPGAARLAAT